MIVQKVKALLIRSAMLVVLCSVMFSFNETPGGDSFTIYLNDKLLIQQYVHADKSVKSFSLAESNATDLLKVNYSHCGRIGTARNIVLKDSQNKSIKQWHFVDAVETAAPTMSLKVKEVLAAQKSSKESKLNLVYASKEMPEGRTLATIIMTSDTKARFE
ncbi:MAG: hypothetical protein ACOYXT_24460 [Bacteroidota bacterium]